MYAERKLEALEFLRSEIGSRISAQNALKNKLHAKIALYN
jgi:hypothetical protein